MFDSNQFSRRQALQIGGLSILASGATSAQAKVDAAATSCIFIMLQGGASHIDLFDPKPNATEEVRGPYHTISTKVPGLHLGELMSETAKVAKHITLIRSMTHKFTNHIAGTYITMTGSDNQPDRDREAHPNDFPGPGAILNHLRDGNTENGVPACISLPNWLSIPGPSNRMPGQYGGMLGSVRDPLLIEGDPNNPKKRALALRLNDTLSLPRLQSRLSVLQSLDQASHLLEQEMRTRQDHFLTSAYDLLQDGRVRKALDLSCESTSIRDRYGRTKFGQSLLLARRLVEAGVQFVSCNAFNQEWDTHGNLVPRYQQIVPRMDQGFAALIEDLNTRSMLDSTLVIKAGEFGRTPKMNNQKGRDHWPNAYSILLAGGGLARGAVYGETDHHGAEVQSGRGRSA